MAVDHFGRLGLDGASTRSIARDAGTPMSSITYHFGGKQGLYLAAADHIAAHMRAQIAPTLEHAERLYGDQNDGTQNDGTQHDGTQNDGIAARATLHAIIAGMVAVMLQDQTAAMAQFIVREQADPTEAFDRIYAGCMAMMLDRITVLLQQASGAWITLPQAKMRAITLLGQVMVFRIARATVMTGMGWTHIGSDEAAVITRTIAANLDAIIDHLQAGAPA